MSGIRQVLRGELGDNFTRFFIAASWFLMAGAALVALLISSEKMSVGILIGGTISGLNYIGLEKDCRRTVRWGTIAAYFGGLAVRMALIALAVTIAFLFFRNFFSPIGLFIGLSIGIINFYILVLGMLAYKFRVKEA